MDDLISRRSAIEAMTDFYDHVGFYDKMTVAKSMRIISDLPAAQHNTDDEIKTMDDEIVDGITNRIVDSLSLIYAIRENEISIRHRRKLFINAISVIAITIGLMLMDQNSPIGYGLFVAGLFWLTADWE